MTTYSQVSKLQLPVLREIIAITEAGSHLSVTEASKLDQRPFGSLYHRNWIGYRAGRGFYATKQGKDAYEEYMGGARKRARPGAPLSHYFDPVAYQFHRKVEKKGNLRTMVA